VTLRTRLTLILSLLTLATIATLGVIATTSVRSSLEDRLDAELRSLRTLPGNGDQNGPDTSTDEITVAPEFTDLRALVIEFDDRFDVRSTSPQLLRDDPARPDADAMMLFPLRTDPNVVIELGSVDGSDHFRAVVSPNRRGGITVYALSTSDISATVNGLVLVFVIGGAAVLAAVTLAVWFVTKRAFDPVERMIDSAGHIALGNLDVRVEATSPINEVERLGSALNAMLENIETTAAEREAATKRLQRFVADASHELRTPVATVLGYVELYQSGATSGTGETADAMDRIGRAGKRMERLVEDLLTLAKLDEGRSAEFKAVDLGQLVTDATTDIAATYRDHTFVLSEIPTSVVISADHDQLTRAMLNILANAAVHNPEDTITTVSVEESANNVRVTISDDGYGIEADELERIFDRFHRSAEGRARSGSGLGLAIVASIVTAHGGTVTAEAAAPRGTTFTIELPYS
jgi:two-component system OmpR family sensor kinase